MTGIKVKENSKSIEVSKKFAAAAAKYGTDEYRILQEVRRDYPGYNVVEIARKVSKSNKPSFKGLTYEYMEAYILSHDDDGTKMRHFQILTSSKKNSEAKVIKAASYQEVKQWFLSAFPDIEACCRTRNELLARKTA